MADLEFSVQDVYLTGLTVERGPMKPSADRMLHAQIGFEVASAEFTPGERALKIETQFKIALYLQSPEEDDAVEIAEESLVGTVNSRFTANVEASNVVETMDAENGRLEPATEAALVAIHPYHRAAIEMHTAMLGVSPLRLPVEWSVVAANLEASGT